MTASTGTRRIKTPLERAQEALDVARRAEVKATAKAASATAQAEETTQALIAARQRLGYAGADPALPEDVRRDVREYLESLNGAPGDQDTISDHRAELEPVLLAYSEWLDDAEGLMASPDNTGDKRTHEELVSAFLAADQED